jgi:hypothetical protein
MLTSMNPPRLRRALGLLAIVALPVAAACSLNSDQPIAPIIIIPPESTTYAPSLGVDIANSTRTADGLFYRDLTVGTGTLVEAGTRVSVRYAGFLTNGQLFDSSATPTALFTFTQGTGAAITGFDRGILGMRVGGSRQLIIPPGLAYGAGTGNGKFPPYSTLVFRVDLKGAQ